MLRRSHISIPVASGRQSDVELKLESGRTWSQRVSGSHQSLRVVEGEAYITEEGHDEDWFLHEGEYLPLEFHKLVVVQGHPAATFVIDDRPA